MISRLFKLLLLFVLALTLFYAFSPESGAERGGTLHSFAASVREKVRPVTELIESEWRRYVAKPKPAAKPIPVRQVLNRIEWRQGKPDSRAEYYFYIHFSRCPACVRFMREFLSRYEEMRQDGRAEIIIIAYDDIDVILRIMESFGATFPVVHVYDKNVNLLPGDGAYVGTPSVFIVKADGARINRGSGLLIADWRKHTVDWQKYVPRKKSFKEQLQAEWKSFLRLFEGV